MLAHLIDTDYHWLSQALAIRDKPGHLFVHFDDERWKTEHPDVRQWARTDVLERLGTSHAEVIGRLSAMTAAELNRSGVHPRGAPYTARDVFQRYPPHDENHERQILELLGQG